MTALNDQPQTTTELSDEEIFRAHEGGKLAIGATASLADPRALSIAYTPGVARVSRAIADDPSLAAKYTWAHRLVAVVSDGTAVLGLGDIGPRAAMPVMEGKAALFKQFANVDAFPICLDTKDADEIVETVKNLAAAGSKHVLVVPISFVSDHVETLHEIDIEHREQARELGIADYRMMPGLNDSPDFIAALAGLVRRAAGVTADRLLVEKKA